MSEYVLIYEQADDGGWGAYVPDLPGVRRDRNHP
jgi:predicted RNase H-like HicB family nuclease